MPSPDDEGGLALGVALLDHHLTRRKGSGIAARTGQHLVGGEELVDRSVDGDAALHHDDDVIAHPLDVGEEMRRQQDGGSVDGHDSHEVTQEGPAGERVEAGDGLVEHEEIGPLRHGEGEGEL